MKEISELKLDDKLKTIKSNIMKLKALGIENYYCANILDWFNEVLEKNYIIHESKINDSKIDQEIFKKYRQKVYWINFGKNIGSEFRDYHYAVVLYESKYTAIVVPLTSKKDESPQWIIDNENVIVDLGEAKGYPHECKQCYACTFLLQSVSKKRLDRCGNKKDGYFDLKLSSEQMNKICDKIKEIAYNTIDIKS